MSIGVICFTKICPFAAPRLVHSKFTLPQVAAMSRAAWFAHGLQWRLGLRVFGVKFQVLFAFLA